MNFKHLAIPALALMAGSYLIPSESQGFALLGGNLNLAERDLRIFNNFTDAAANNNTAADPNFPGYDGAELAIWKGAAEWGSELHGGTGGGDPHQPNGIGSGNANFDSTWQGNANGSGNLSRIVSEISGSDGGTFAVAVQNANGWSIFFYSVWNWSDGPGGLTGNQVDMQGIMCHEYGHALGLGHSAIGSATMFGSTTNGFQARSIAADDSNGLQAIYGARAASKPSIDDLNLCSGELTITGENFSATQNQVWFTQAGSGGNGDPVTLFNVASTAGGTQIVVNVPANAGSGDVLVKQQGNSFSNLSNAFPLDVNVEGNCSSPLFEYCTGDGGSGFGCTDCPCNNNATPGSAVGCLNGSGTGAKISGGGLASFSNGDLFFNVTGANPLTFGVLTSGLAALPTNPASPCFGLDSGITSVLLDGLRCVGQGLVRHGSRAFDASGSNTFPWANNIVGTSGSVPGQFRYFQVFYREQPTLGCNTGQNTSTAIAVEIVP